MLGAGATALAVGVGLDRVLGEPPTRWHPVVWFAQAMNAVEGRNHRDSRAAGMLHAGVGIALAAGAASLIRRVAGPPVALALSTGVATAGRMLRSEVSGVGEALAADDLDVARRRVAMLVGRGTDGLDESDVARAAIETVAENTVDAVTASLWWGAVAGAHGVLIHRALNTMDAMVGHRNERYGSYGWTAAKLDDLANWVPARLTALAVLVVAPSGARQVFETVRRDARHHPSPNGGVIEAAFAGSLGVRLGGSNTYGGVTEDRGALGDGESPTASDVERAVALADRAGVAVLVMCAVLSLGIDRWVRIR